ncbi:MAG: phage holin family protein [Candidatus Rokuibacteriota bacterium]
MKLEDRATFSATPGPPRLFDLVDRLIREVGTLLDQKAALLSLEIRQQLSAALRGLVTMAAGAVLAAAGLLLLGMAAALWVGAFIGSEAGGYGAVGVALAIVGGGVIAVTRRQFTSRAIKPEETMQELRRDAKWIKDEL